MILLVNVFLTDEVLNQDTYRYQRGYLDYPYQPNKYDKVDIFKYAMASYSVIPFSKVLIYCKLDEKYKNREDDLREFIEKEFAGQKLELSFDRLEHQDDWQNIYREKLVSGPGNPLPPNEPIWFCCNHDHIFMDYNLDILNEGVELLKIAGESASVYFSHWPELLHKASHPHNEKHGPTNLHGNYLGFMLLNNNDSIQIITPELYKRWWFEEDYGDAFLPRSDYRLSDDQGNPIGYDIRNGRRQMLHHYCYVPLRELCRHYDGYGHVEINSNLCPAITIPPGFFENKIKIRYCWDDYRPDCVNINPTNQYYRVLDKNGVDYKWVMDDIPLFWKNRIVDIDMPEYIRHQQQEPDVEMMYIETHRNESVIDTASARMVMDNININDHVWYDRFCKLNMKYVYE